MTVAELIAALEKMPQDAPVVRYAISHDDIEFLCTVQQAEYDGQISYEDHNGKPQCGPAVTVC